jgi:hypothetical protein
VIGSQVQSGLAQKAHGGFAFGHRYTRHMCDRRATPLSRAMVTTSVVAAGGRPPFVAALGRKPVGARGLLPGSVRTSTRLVGSVRGVLSDEHPYRDRISRRVSVWRWT